MANEIISEIRLELDKFRADLKQAEKDGKKAGENAGAGLGDGVEAGLANMLGGMKGKLLALAGSLAGAFTLKESIAAAMDQEKAVVALNSALALSGHYTDQASGHFQAYASQLQSTLGISDDVILQGGAMLATLGKLSGEGLDRSTKAALNFATGMRIDVGSAFDILSKAAAGNIGALNRYGFEIKDTGDKARDFEKALLAVEARFGGRAETNINTFGGALARAKGQFGEVLESLGNIVIKSPLVVSFLNLIAKGFAGMAKSIEDASKGDDPITRMAKSITEIGHGITTYVIAPLELAYNIVKLFVINLETAFMGLITVFYKVSEAIQTYLVSPVIRFLGDVLGPMVAYFDKDLGAAITNSMRTIAAEADAGMKRTADSAAALTASFATQSADYAGVLFDFSVSAATDNLLTKTDEVIATAAPIVKEDFKKLSDSIKPIVPPTFFDSFIEGWTQAVNATKAGSESMKQKTEALGKSVYGTFVTGFGNAFTAMGAAIVKGENVLGAFGKAILGTFGDIAIQLGSFFIAEGIGMLFTPGGQAAGVGLIAAGGGMNVVGGVLKALAGAGGGAGAAAPSAGGGVAAAGGSGSAPLGDMGQSFAENERGQVGTKVEVHVAGNILDRRETGLELAEVINEAFGSNGVKFAQGAA